MDIIKIYEKLKHYNRQIYVRQQEDILINHVKLYKDNNSNFRQDVIYIVKASKRADFRQFEACTNILCINDTII